MPRKQLDRVRAHRSTPNDSEAPQTIDTLIDAAFAIEDETGHIRRVG